MCVCVCVSVMIVKSYFQVFEEALPSSMFVAQWLYMPICILLLFCCLLFMVSEFYMARSAVTGWADHAQDSLPVLDVSVEAKLCPRKAADAAARYSSITENIRRRAVSWQTPRMYSEISREILLGSIVEQSSWFGRQLRPNFAQDWPNVENTSERTQCVLAPVKCVHQL